MSRPRTLDHDWYPREVPANVEIGERTWLYSSYAFLHYRSERPRGLHVGADCGIYINTMFDLGPSAEVVIGDHSTLAGPVFAVNGLVEIGSHALISAGVVFADLPFAVPAGPGLGAPEPARAPRPTVVGENVWIGTRAVVFAGISIGEGAIIGASTVVDFDVPAFSIVAGHPGRVVGSAAGTS